MNIKHERDYRGEVCYREHNDLYDCDFIIDENATISSLFDSIARDNQIKRGSAAWRGKLE